ncbi:restriction endonuclease subunit S [Spirosoma litoris]
MKLGEVFDFIKSESHARESLTYQQTHERIYYIHYGDIHAKFQKPFLDFNIEENIPFVKDGLLDESKVSFLKEGDLILVDASEDYLGVGESVEIKHLGDRKAISGLHTFVLRDQSNQLVNGFKGFVLKHEKVANNIRKIATGSSVYGISKNNLAKQILYLPPLSEQAAIARVLDASLAEIRLHERQLATLREQKRGLMQRLLTGQVRVKIHAKPDEQLTLF